MPNPTFEHLPPQRQKTIVDSGIAAFSQHGYAEAGTDAITKACGIAKGLLYHYFGSKRAFYLHCMRTALDRLMLAPQPPPSGDFYAILFAALDDKLRLYLTSPAEIRFMARAAWDSATEIAAEKSEIFRAYQTITEAHAANTIDAALAALPLKQQGDAPTREAFALYLSAINNRLLQQYRDRPESFFAEAEAIKTQYRTYIDLMLYGIAERQQT